MAYQLKTQTIYCGDNLKMLKDVPDESVDLIYIDPPFNSNRNYECFWGDVQEKRAFEDRFGDAQAYIDYMRPRVQQLYRVLKKTGSFYYHCDWHASHYVKIMLDGIFNFNNFRNEIIWQRTPAHKSPKQYGRNSDKIFYYTKSKKYIFNVQYVNYTKDYIKNTYNLEDENGIYMSDNLTGSGATKGESCTIWRGYNPTKRNRHWAIPINKIEQLVGANKAMKLTIIEKLELLYQNGLIFFSQNGVPRYKRYLKEMGGLPLQEIWTDITPISSQAKERLGYPTQKPLALLERILKASSNEGDVVLDAFCGCGTTLAAAQKLNRKWIGIDISPTACRVMADRLYSLFHLREGKDFYIEDLPKTEDDLRQLPPFEFQNWAVIALGGIPNTRKSGDFGIDGKLYHIDYGKSKKEADKKYSGDMVGEIEIYYPIQVKQKDKAGRPDIDSFETAIRRDGRHKGYFISFDFSKDAIDEIKRLDKAGEIEIVPITVKELLRTESFKQ